MNLEEIYNEYFTTIYRYIYSISGDGAIAEEITQITFFKALKNIDRFRGESSIRTWLTQIAKHSYYDYLEREKRTISLDAAQDSGTVTEMEPLHSSPSATPEEVFLQAADARAAHRILHGLPEPYKEVFSLRVFAELPFSDIGSLFGKSDSWARVTFYRARMMIREKMTTE